mmetsp:Transcript_11186/g.41862  ORF Transcript_11186/g.41862 Transcript_11186/m.41862 type:complete len:720 (+) Transcript_11186:904-3063(+)
MHHGKQPKKALNASIPSPSRKNKRKRPVSTSSKRKKVSRENASDPCNEKVDKDVRMSTKAPISTDHFSVPQADHETSAARSTRRARRSAGSTKKVSASYYLGYVDDEESVSDIMRKFEMLEALQEKQNAVMQGIAPPNPRTCDTVKVGISDLSHVEGVSSEAGAVIATNPATSHHHDDSLNTLPNFSDPRSHQTPPVLHVQQNENTLDQRLQEELFRMTYSRDYVTNILAASLLPGAQTSDKAANSRKSRHDYSNSLTSIHDFIAGLENGEIYSTTSDESDGYYSGASSAEDDDYDTYGLVDETSVNETVYHGMDKKRDHVSSRDTTSHVISRRRMKRKRTPSERRRGREFVEKRSSRRSSEKDKTKFLENVRIYLDLKTNETVAMIHKSGASDLHSPTSLLHPFHSVTVNNATIQSLQQNSSTGRNRKSGGKIKSLKIPSGELPVTWAHRIRYIQHGDEVKQRYVQDAAFSFEKFQEDDPLADVQSCNAKSHASLDTRRFITSDLLQNFDFSTLPLYFSGDYEAILLSPPWEKWNRSVKPLYLLPLKKLMKQRGYVFIWIVKELIPDVFEYFATNGYTYADNLCWVHQQPDLVPDSRTFFRQDKTLLFLFRMDNKSTKKMNIRHQRSPDTVFDFKVPSDAIYQMIETFLPTTNKTRLHVWAPQEKPARKSWTCLTENLPVDWDVAPVINSASIIQEQLSAEDSGAYDEEDYEDEEEDY